MIFLHEVEMYVILIFGLAYSKRIARILSHLSTVPYSQADIDNLAQLLRMLLYLSLFLFAVISTTYIGTIFLNSNTVQFFSSENIFGNITKVFVYSTSIESKLIMPQFQKKKLSTQLFIISLSIGHFGINLLIYKNLEIQHCKYILHSWLNVLFLDCALGLILRNYILIFSQAQCMFIVMLSLVITSKFTHLSAAVKRILEKYCYPTWSETRNVTIIKPRTIHSNQENNRSDVRIFLIIIMQL